LGVTQTPAQLKKDGAAIYTYNTPEEMESEMEFLTQYQTPVGENVLV
jgi:hypothetical protein